MAGKTGASGRQRLIDATLDCLAEHGYHRSSVRQIAKQAGVTAGLLRHYFTGKTELMVETFRYNQRSILMTCLYDAAHAGPDPIKKLEAFTKSIFVLNSTNSKRRRVWINFMDLALTDQNISTEYSKSYDLHIREIGNCIIEIYAKKNEFISSEKAQTIAIGIKSLIDGLCLECSVNPPRISPNDASTIALDFISAGLDVCFPTSRKIAL